MTKIRNYFVIFFLTVCVPAAAQRYSISPINADRVLDRDSLRTWVEHLCSRELGGRATGSEGGRKTALWLEEQFKAIGLKPIGNAWRHGFVTGDGLARNVLGLIPGSYTNPARYVVLMAHFDNLGTLGGRFYPGADANASGVAALLQLARMATHMNECRKVYPHGLIIAALDAKEKNQAGAEQLWRQLSADTLTDPVTGKAITSSQIDLVVNLDQLGSTLAPITEGNKRYLLMLSEEYTGRRSSLERVNQDPGFGFELGYTYYGSKDFTKLFYRSISDQRVFLEHGIPAVMFTSGITFRNNKPEDNAASLDYDILTARTRLIFFWLDKVL